MKTLIPHLSRTFVLVALLMATLNNATFAQDREHGFDIGLVYPLSLHGIEAPTYANVFSLSGLVGISRAERGFTASGFANIIKEDASGFQVAGFLNKIGGPAEGFKAAGFMNIYKNADGFQAAGFSNFASGNVKGMQAAGFMNTSLRFTGFQVAGFMNKAENVKGTQAAGFLNLGQDVKGNQLAGFINLAKKVDGVQIAGFINIADSSEYPIALVNIIKNGEQFMGITTDDNFTSLVTFRSGSKKMYGIVGLGYNFRNEKDVFAIQYGIGAHLLNYKKFRLNVEGTTTQLEDFKKGDFTKTSITVLPAFKVSKRVEVYAGPSINYVNTNSEDGRDLVDHYIWNRNNVKNEYGIYIGYSAGVHMKL